MDIAKSIFTQPVMQPTQLGDLDKIDSLSDEKKKQVAKDFESVFIGKLLDEMKKSVTNWSDEKDGASEQIDGIFSMFLARDLADNGGMGLWKQIYKSMTNINQDTTTNESLDKKV